MSRAARTLYAFAMYLALLAVVLLLVPNVMLSAFGLPTTTEVWIRVVGMLVGVLALYYYVAARTDARGVMWASVLARFSIMACFAIFVVAGWVGWQLILFGVVDAVAAAWTWSALRDTAAA